MPLVPVSLDSPAGEEAVCRLLLRGAQADDSCGPAVAAIIVAVRRRGDDALLEYTRKFDAPDFAAGQLRVTAAEIDAAVDACPREISASLALAAERIRGFHLEARERSWFHTRDDGVITGRMVRPVDAAGLYVPGGQGGATPLVSSVLMNAIPAAIAGVGRLVMTTPPGKGGALHPALMVAARLAGVTELYRAGSAWAIAALAYGTGSIRPVDVVVGPGNRYVTEAKRQVSGVVGIDMIAGPSEVCIVADHSAPAAVVAADMLAQAEHDADALAVAILSSAELAEEVRAELGRQLDRLTRGDIARRALAARGLLLVCPDIDRAMELANRIAAEHLELLVENPWERLTAIRHAGAVFLGPHTPEAAGDYIAGPNHVLPTMGTARFSSALGVETFQKRSSVIAYSRQGLANDSEHILRLAALEGLDAHARSVMVRTTG